MEDKRICPKFTEKEMLQIDTMVKSGYGRCRTDFVRKATIIFIEKTTENTVSLKKEKGA
ncbi:MAG: hypothetical protein KRP56_03020 [Candidatus Methanogranum gryphiswaldense]|nr:MAG: hypothetical protein KRP56_03020 [Candidatus Methanogranum sp. U3.2.1]